MCSRGFPNSDGVDVIHTVSSANQGMTTIIESPVYSGDVNQSETGGMVSLPLHCSGFNSSEHK